MLLNAYANIAFGKWDIANDVYAQTGLPLFVPFHFLGGGVYLQKQTENNQICLNLFQSIRFLF